MFHLELRQFPNAAWRFNLSEPELGAIVEPWTREQVVDVGERKWSPHKATLTILEGPELELQELSMGRGWRTAQRQGEDVTSRMLEHLRQIAGIAGPTGTTAATGAGDGASLDAVAFGVQIATLLGSEPLALLEAWRVVASAADDLKPSETLARAEAELARRAGG